MNIFIVGVGMGDTKYLTKIAEEKIKNADIIIGAKRVAEPYVNEKKVFFEYEPTSHPQSLQAYFPVGSTDSHTVYTTM